MNIKKIKKISSVISVTLVAVFCAVFHVEAAPEGKAKQNEKIMGTATAGVTALLCQEVQEVVTLTAGVSASLVDFETKEADVIRKETRIVASAGGTVDKKESSFCGYKNLGIADVSGCLNVRKEASTDSDVVGKMTDKNACEILSSEGEWVKIKSGKVKGYVKKEYLLTGNAAIAVAKEEISTFAIIKTDTLRVRQKNSLDSKVISLVGKGEELAVIKYSNKWVKVEVDNHTGFVAKEFVELKDKLPVAQTLTELKYGEGVTDARVSLVSNAVSYVGNPYVWGGTSLTNGVDCSGFTMKILGQYGVYLPHSSRAQPSYGKKISSSEAQPGDLFFYGSGSSINHVAIYIGNGQIVHASNHKDGIKISNAFYRTPICVCSDLS